MDYCEMFRQIEVDPTAKCVLTIKQYREAAIHAYTCDDCADIVERVSAKYKDKTDTIGFNPN